MKIVGGRMHRRYFVLAMALTVAFGLILGIYYMARSWESARTYSTFRGISNDRVNTIQERLHDQLLKIEYLRAFYDSSDEARYDNLMEFVQEFRTFADEAFEGDDEIRTIVFAPRVERQSLGSFTEILKNDYNPSYRVVEVSPDGTSVPPRSRPFYYPAISTEPEEDDSWISGVDIWTEPNARSAIDRALSTGGVAVASPYRSPGQTLSENDFRAFVPLIRNDRSDVPIGFLMISLKIDEVVDSALSGSSSVGIDFILMDHTETGPDTLLHVHPSRTRVGTEREIDITVPAEFEHTFDISAGDRVWRITARSAPAFLESHSYSLSLSVLGGGLLSISILITFLLLSLRRAKRIEGLVAERTEQLTLEVEQHKRSEEALRQSQKMTNRAVMRLNHQVRRIELLSDVGDLLQRCRTLDEAYQVTANYAERLFPGIIGTLRVYQESRPYLESVAEWGGLSIDTSAAMQPDECWSLRRGKVHLSSVDGLICRHITASGHADRPHLCIPLAVQGETHGVIHLAMISSPSGGESESDSATPVKEESDFDEGTQRLASAFAEHAALAFANIRLRQNLQDQAIRDPLTGLFNRRYMEESLDREIHRAGRENTPLGVIMLDIDFFKKFNDQYGHEAGDRVLKAVAELLQVTIRQEDIACRFGGEEFILILPGASRDSMIAKAHEIREKVRHLQVRVQNEEVPTISVSLGVAVLDAETAARETLIRAADDALYAAKAGGRNRVEVHN
jgi:diguanylate cyclase (GGDEF)-like protein